MKWWDQMPWSSFSECWALSQLFHSPLDILIKLTKTKHKERILKAAREKQQVTYKGNSICLIADLSVETAGQKGMADHLTSFLRNLYVCQEGTVRSGHRTDWFQIGKGVRQGYILSPCLFNLYTGYIMQMEGWMKHKLESRLQGEISITSREGELKSLWLKWKRTVKKLA